MTDETSGPSADDELDPSELEQDQPDVDQPDGDQPDVDQPDVDQPDGDQPDGDQLDVDELDQDQLDALADAEQAMNEARARLAEVPAEVVVTNHVMGLYELAAIHLSATPPDLHQSALAIDAVACLVDGLGERLGDDHATMQDALNNIRLAFVQIKGQSTPD